VTEDKKKRVLFVSASIGLGHVTRDVAIVNELRRLSPGIDVDWLAASPAREFLRERGEYVLPEAEEYADVTEKAEMRAAKGGLNVTLWAFSVRKEWEANARLALGLMRSGRYALTVGDETYEIAMALLGKAEPPCPFVVLYDFIGLDSVSRNPLEWLVVYYFNRQWAKPPTTFDIVFLGEMEDIADRRFGPLLPNRREFAERYIVPVGYPVPFDPATLTNRAALRAELGYGEEPLVLVTIGGTAIGQELLELCHDAYPLAARRLPGLRMVLVCGPRLSMDCVESGEGLEIRGYVPDLYRHMAACDLAITQAGGTTTLELTALRRPFLYFPLEDHAEQLIDVSGRLHRHRAGVEMLLRETSAADLAARICVELGRTVDYADIPIDGARVAAAFLVAKLAGQTPHTA
jgi:UDP:flavonoid glycosyltransferase YjiC (YdhE family)